MPYLLLCLTYAEQSLASPRLHHNNASTSPRSCDHWVFLAKNWGLTSRKKHWKIGEKIACDHFLNFLIHNFDNQKLPSLASCEALTTRSILPWFFCKLGSQKHAMVNPWFWITDNVCSSYSFICEPWTFVNHAKLRDWFSFGSLLTP